MRLASLTNMTRSGTALVMVMMVIMLMTGMLAILSDRLLGQHKLLAIDLATQRAQAAAEAVAGLQEAELADLLANNELSSVTRNPDTGLANDPWEGISWFGDCIVRWRVEPVVVTTPDGSTWFSNPLGPGADVNTIATSRTDASGAVIPYGGNANLYHFRIATEAYALRDRALVDGMTLADLETNNKLPWQDPSQRLCRVQTTRVLQVQLDSLLQYALFYAPTGRDGDLEIHPGGGFRITGNVHSNGGIFLRPQADVHLRDMSGGNRTHVVGVDGIFAYHKPDWMQSVGGDLTADPYAYNDNKTSTAAKATINSMGYYGAADSRNKTEMEARWGAYVLDGNRGASVKRTLANISELAGRPFEAQVRSDELYIYVEPTGWEASTSTFTYPTDPSNPDNWTILPNPGMLPGDFYYDPMGVRDGDDTNNFDFTDTPSAGITLPVAAVARMLYYSTDPLAIGNYRTTPHANRLLDAQLMATPPMDIDGDDDGVLDSSGVTVNVDRRVSAIGLRQYRQVVYDASGDEAPQRDVYVGGVYNEAASKAVIDIFDPNGYRQRAAWDGTDFAGADVKVGDTGWDANLPPVSKADTDDDGFADNEVQGVYLRWAMQGKDGEPTRGLVIRERPMQRVFSDSSGALTWTGMPARPNAGTYATDPTYPVFGGSAGKSDASRDAAQEYANYLKSQYTVFWGDHDITDVFFDYGIDTARTPTTSFDPTAPTDTTKSIPGGLVCFEDDVFDRREGTFTQYFFLSKDGNYTSNGNAATGSGYVSGNAGRENWWRDNYRVNTLTLNMERVLDFIKNYDGKDPEDDTSDDPNWPSAAPDPTALEDHFSGQIYVARTRRSPGMQPDRPRWIVDHFVNWRNGDGINFLDYDSRPIGDGDGTVQSDEVLDWRTFGGPDAVFHSAVRLWNASDLDSGAEFVDDMGTPLDTTDDYYAKQGLTVVTPNLLYVWGDYNTTMYNDSTADQDTTAPGLQYLAKDYDRSTYPNDPSDSDPWRLPAAALMCDRVVLLSNEWQDEAQQWNVEPNASSAVTLNASLLLGVTPTIQQPDGNCPESGGVHNAVLYLEDQDAYNFRGSLVMMNRRLYGNSVNGAGNPTCTLRQSLYDAPNRFVNMNTDLFTARGQPPLTPFSVTIVRTANYIAEQN